MHANAFIIKAIERYANGCSSSNRVSVYQLAFTHIDDIDNFIITIAIRVCWIILRRVMLGKVITFTYLSMAYSNAASFVLQFHALDEMDKHISA